MSRVIRIGVFLAAACTAAAQRPDVVFLERSGAADVEFRHENGATDEKFMPETMGGGVVVFDYDGDGWADLFFVNGGSFEDPSVARSARHMLFRNEGGFRFAPAAPAIPAPSSYGMGACASDYDNDGWTDLYITGVGPNMLLRNTGGGFLDVTGVAGVESPRWSSSCAFGDLDNDGNVDLYVVNYVDFTPEGNVACYQQQIRAYCHPDVYEGAEDVLFRNNGDGTFTDWSDPSGVSLPEGKGLGVVWLDYDSDGRLDVYVANDSVPNFLFRNLGDGRFEESALWAGAAVGRHGQPLAGMGADAGDVDGDGREDIVVTNLDRETHTLYGNLGDGLFEDRTFESGIGQATLPYVGFGTVFFDHDNDGDLDLVIGNGDVIDNVRMFRDNTTYPQRNLLLENDGLGRFRDTGAAGGFALEKVSRAVAAADLDNDGDLDLVVVNNGETADVLENDGGNRRNGLLVQVIGTTSNRNGVGARIEVTLPDRKLVRTVRAGSSYLAQNDPRAHFGLGSATSADRLEIVWPGGERESFTEIPANVIVTIRQGEGLVGQTPFASGEGAAAGNRAGRLARLSSP